MGLEMSLASRFCAWPAMLPLLALYAVGPRVGAQPPAEPVTLAASDAAPARNDRAEVNPTMSDPDIAQAIALMDSFAERTGLTSGHPPRRYLWTDAFAVCNWLGLARTTGDRRYLTLALRLVDQVHQRLGRHRTDGQRHGWISGLPEAEGAAHPTRGGLRIGKPLPERESREPFDQHLEWERDGQYFHYLAKWMHALDQVARTTGESRFNAWARELALAAHDAFTYQPASSPAPLMYWKMSVDLTRPLISSMGQHDPLDGYVGVMQLRATAETLGRRDGPELEQSARRFASMTERSELASADPLGIGGLLADAYRIAQLRAQDAMRDDGLLERLLDAAQRGLQLYATSGDMQAPAEHRLAFRELGLSIGLVAMERLSRATERGQLQISRAARTQLAALLRYLPLGDAIEAFWRRPENRRTDSWSAHRDINEVMLATRLAPEGFLELPLPQ